MYPRNNASPEQIAIGPVVQISDGAVQTASVTVRVFPNGGAEADGGGTTAYSTDGVVLYTPTQAETNYTSFVLIAKKAACIPASVTVVTTASATAGQTVPADGAITAAKIAADAITAAKIADDAITAASIATGALTADAFAADALVAATFATGSLDNKGNWNVGKTGYSLTNLTVTAGTTLGAGTHTAQTGDSYAIVSNGTYGNAQLVRSATPANALAIGATGYASANVVQWNGTGGLVAYLNPTSGFNTPAMALSVIAPLSDDPTTTALQTCFDGTIKSFDDLDTAQDTQHNTTQAYLSTNLGANGANATEAGGTGDQFIELPAVTLTSGERTTLAAALEAAIINELDGTAVMQAIADLIASDMTTGDLSVQAIASAVKTAMEAVGSHLTLVKAKTDSLTFTGTDVKATLDGEEVTPTTASKTGYALSAAGVTAVQAGLATEDKQDIIDTLLDKIAVPIIGTSSGAGTGTEIFVYGGVTLTATVDESGNRDAVVFS